MNRLKISSIISIARSEYLRWITNSRIIIIGILCVFMKTLAVDPLLERAEKMNVPLTIFEPFVAIGNSGMLVMFIPCVFLILISDYPIISGNTLFFVQRSGRTNWLLGQILFVIFAIISYMGMILFASILISSGVFRTEWSETVRLYCSKFPEEYDSFASELLPSNLYNQIPLITSVLQTFILMSAYLFLLVLILYFFKLIYIKSAGLIAVFIVIGLGVATCSLKTSAMWWFPMANTIVWLHYTEVLRDPVVPIWKSYAYFGIMIVILLIIDIFLMRRFQFKNIEQVG